MKSLQQIHRNTKGTETAARGGDETLRSYLM